MKFFISFGTVLLSLVAINISHASSPLRDNSTDCSESARFRINKSSVYLKIERDFICREYDETLQPIKETKHELEKLDCTNPLKELSDNLHSSKEDTPDTNRCPELRDQELKQYKKLVYLTHIKRHFYGR